MLEKVMAKIRIGRSPMATSVKNGDEQTSDGVDGTITASSLDILVLESRHGSLSSRLGGRACVLPFLPSYASTVKWEVHGCDGLGNFCGRNRVNRRQSSSCTALFSLVAVSFSEPFKGNDDLHFISYPGHWRPLSIAFHTQNISQSCYVRILEAYAHCIFGRLSEETESSNWSPWPVRYPDSSTMQTKASTSASRRTIETLNMSPNVMDQRRSTPGKLSRDEGVSRGSLCHGRSSSLADGGVRVCRAILETQQIQLDRLRV
jgi:hypothetical protein